MTARFVVRAETVVAEVADKPCSGQTMWAQSWGRREKMNARGTVTVTATQIRLVWDAPWHQSSTWNAAGCVGGGRRESRGSDGNWLIQNRWGWCGNDDVGDQFRVAHSHTQNNAGKTA